jgi:hypothetical protein
LRYVLLTDEPALWQLAGREQIEDRTDRGGRRDLNGAQYPAVHIAAVDLVRVDLLNEMAFLVAAAVTKMITTSCRVVGTACSKMDTSINELFPRDRGLSADIACGFSRGLRWPPAEWFALGN